MTTSERFCFGGGYIVGAREWLPDDRSEYNFSIPTPTIGCNHLVCGACGNCVRSWANMARRGYTRIDPAALWAHDGDEPPAELEVDKAARTYACECVWTQTVSNQALDIDVTPGTSLFSSDWRCAGHPVGPLPADLRADFAAVDDTTLTGAIETLLGRRSAQRSGLGEPFPSPCLDVWRLEAYLPEALSSRFRAIVRQQLASSESPFVLQAALSYLAFRAVPEDGRAWLAALEAHPSIGDIEGPDFPGENLRRRGAVLLEVLSNHEKDHQLEPSHGLVSAFFDYFDEQGLTFRLRSIARLAYGAVLNEIAARGLRLEPSSARALNAVWDELSKAKREAAKEVWAAGDATEPQRQALVTALPQRVARGIGDGEGNQG